MALRVRAAQGTAQASFYPDPARHPREGEGLSPKLRRWAPAFAGVTDTTVAVPHSRVTIPAKTIPPATALPVSPLVRWLAQRPVPLDPVPIAPAVSAPPPLPGFDLATKAYARLKTGDRRGAQALFGAALAAAGTPAPPHADAWQNERRRLNRHWSGDTYWQFRDAGTGGAAASPILGGGQSGGTLGYAIDPLAARPVAIIGRIYAAHDQHGLIDGDTAQGALGLRWQITPGVSIAAERLVAIGNTTSGDWKLRLAGGGQWQRGVMTVDGYAEAGLRGNGDAYAGGQARAMAQIGRAHQLIFTAGPGVWGSIQVAQTTASRVDVGAGVTVTTPVSVTAKTPVGVAIGADWRWRVAGNAAPGSGPVVTVSAAF